MILGWFEPPDSRPLIRARVWLVWRNLREDVKFQVDTRSPSTVLAAGDFPGHGSIAGDDLVAVDGAPGITVAAGYQAMLTFPRDSGPPAVYLRDILVAEGEPGTSRLGRDILHEWLMVYDPNGDNLLCEPLRSDV